MAYPVPADEQARLAELRSYDILDTPPEGIYDDLCYVASNLCDTEAAAITLIDEERQWFKSEIGLDVDEHPREHSFCTHAIMDPERVMVVENASEDPRFEGNPFVREDPGIRFYAGAPLRTPEGRGIGAICAIDDAPREIEPEQLRGLKALSRMVMTQLELRRRSNELRNAKAKLEHVNEELRRSNEELDRFASVVSHELKDPLSQVVSNLDLLDAEPGKELDAEDVALLEDARSGGDRMHELIQDILRYARASGGGLEVERADPNALIDEALEGLSSRIQAEDARITRDEAPPVEVDPSLVRQVFKNLVGNAIKYRGEEPPRIEIVSQRHDDGWVRFGVKDNGIGIPEEDQGRLFEVFHRASNAKDREGTGVGLALSARIVERHDGEIWVDSVPGEGSTFWFTLPAEASA